MTLKTKKIMNFVLIIFVIAFIIMAALSFFYDRLDNAYDHIAKLKKIQIDLSMEIMTLERVISSNNKMIGERDSLISNLQSKLTTASADAAKWKNFIDNFESTLKKVDSNGVPGIVETVFISPDLCCWPNFQMQGALELLRSLLMPYYLETISK